ncbi:MAG: energy transducer TonB [Ignavibacteria bacterium]|nr:energy transducer TonB [Ignavibacteria bacterium]
MLPNDMKNSIALPYEEMLFSGKNTAYGAFKLRTQNDRDTTLSTIVASIFFLFALAWPLLMEKTEIKNQNGSSGRISISNVDLPSQNEQEKISPQDIVIERRSLAKMIAFTVPTIQPDDAVHNEIPSITDLEGAIISTVTRDGLSGVDQNLMPDFVTADVSPVEEKSESDKANDYILIAEEPPVYRGGEAALMEFLATHMQYPEIAKRAQIEGTVFIAFVIDKNGKPRNFRVLKGLGGGCEEEALRVLQLMDNWSPGRQSGRPVSVQVSIPISFKLKSL